MNELSVQDTPESRPYAFVSTDQLAAGVETNSPGNIVDGTAQDPNRLAVQTVEKNNYKRTGIWSQEWRYRDPDTEKTVELPWAKIAVAGDENGDKMVNCSAWQLYNMTTDI